MDKNINTRSSVALVNLKTLEMNCTNIHKPTLKTMRKAKNGRVHLGGCVKTNCDPHYYCKIHQVEL
mgnify:CR=1 FL=1